MPVKVLEPRGNGEIAIKGSGHILASIISEVSATGLPKLDKMNSGSSRMSWARKIPTEDAKNTTLRMIPQRPGNDPSSRDNVYIHWIPILGI